MCCKYVYVHASSRLEDLICWVKIKVLSQHCPVKLKALVVRIHFDQRLATVTNPRGLREDKEQVGIRFLSRVTPCIPGTAWPPSLLHLRPCFWYQVSREHRAGATGGGFKTRPQILWSSPLQEVDFTFHLLRIDPT